uniref:Protein kinase domain-containing protein n=1 Tax=Helianthus annuus TaxID=4232 RepID=A0A251VMH4_HELAN
MPSFFNHLLHSTFSDMDFEPEREKEDLGESTRFSCAADENYGGSCAADSRIVLGFQDFVFGYCLADDRFLDAVKFLDSGDGAGWELLHMMLNPDFRNRLIAEAVLKHRLALWLASLNDGKYSSADYAKASSEKLSKNRAPGEQKSWNPFEEESNMKRKRFFIIKLLQGVLSGLAYMHDNERFRALAHLKSFSNLMAEGLQSGWTLLRRPTTPATCGQATEVPDSILYGNTGSGSSEYAAMIFTPGATISGCTFL